MNNPASPSSLSSNGEDPEGAAQAAAKAAQRAANNAEDRILVRATLEEEEGGSRDAYDTLFRKYRERVYRVLWGMLRNREDALDATQDVFFRALRALGGFDLEASFYTWLYRIAVNRGIDYIRDRQRRRSQEFDGEYMEPRHDSPPSQRFQRAGQELESEEIRRRIDQALALLSEDHRAVFLLYTEQDLSYEEIAEIVDVPVGTVMSRLHHARKNLSRQLPGSWDPGGRRTREVVDKKRKKRS